MTSTPDRQPGGAADPADIRAERIARVSVRPASTADEPVLRRLWQEFEAEVPEPPGFPPHTWRQTWETLEASIAAGVVYLAEDGDEPLGLLHARPASAGRWHVELVHVRAPARRRGVATTLVRELAAQLGDRGVEYVSLEVLQTNAGAREFWRGLGFEPVEALLLQPAAELGRRLAAPPESEG